MEVLSWESCHSTLHDANRVYKHEFALKVKVVLEQEISTIDREEAAVLSSDISAIEQSWADDITVNGPNNQVLQAKLDAVAWVHAGLLAYASFERDVEAVLLRGGIASLMGLETVKPQSPLHSYGEVDVRQSPARAHFCTS